MQSRAMLDGCLFLLPHVLQSINTNWECFLVLPLLVLFWALRQTAYPKEQYKNHASLRSRPEFFNVPMAPLTNHQQGNAQQGGAKDTPAAN